MRTGAFLFGSPFRRKVTTKKCPQPDKARFHTSSENMLKGLSLKQLSQVFSGAFKPEAFADRKLRHATLIEMRKIYCSKMLEECVVSSSTLEKLADPMYLPRREEIVNAFKLNLPSPFSAAAQHSRVLDNIEADMELIERILNTPPESRSFEDNYRLEFGPVTFSALFAFAEKNNIYEFFNREYVSALSEYLAERHSLLPLELRDRPIVEVAAGSGRLSHFLNLSKLPVESIATDDGSWTLSQPFPVETISHEQAIAKYEPAIVICSWMPENTDFTSSWRSFSCLKEYVLIGTADSGLSGLPWETWGFVSPYLPDGLSEDELSSMDASDPKSVTLLSLQTGFESKKRDQRPPFEVDGFRRSRVDASRFQISRRDCSPSACFYSETVSFQRLGGQL